MWRSFPYSQRAFMQNLVLIGALIPITMMLFLVIEADIMYMAIIVTMEVITFIVLGVSPLLTTHEIGDRMLVLRQGWYFRAQLPISDIKSVTRVQRGPARTGVFFRLLSSTLYVTSRRHDLIELHLKGKRPFGFALGKKADRVVFDVKDTNEMLGILESALSFTPVDT